MKKEKLWDDIQRQSGAYVSCHRRNYLEVDEHENELVWTQRDFEVHDFVPCEATRVIQGGVPAELEDD